MGWILKLRDVGLLVILVMMHIIVNLNWDRRAYSNADMCRVGGMFPYNHQMMDGSQYLIYSRGASSYNF